MFSFFLVHVSICGCTCLHLYRCTCVHRCTHICACRQEVGENACVFLQMMSTLKFLRKSLSLSPSKLGWRPVGPIDMSVKITGAPPGVPSPPHSPPHLLTPAYCTWVLGVFHVLLSSRQKLISEFIPPDGDILTSQTWDP